ncbi:hypothetical protein CTR2_R20440 [Comamonas thiooxydans]|uniref:hypothetical protein n=1 Tax=Comamonas thiooxydans TaxID=363952 RepID=UPI001123747B|nr:hypothetical protein [Comamonas thiooxydans]BDR08706.1 hypothetical protein CTR2_R20440 [Comamonas thiooxydans]
MSKTVHTSPISPPPGQKDRSARLAASAQVDQVEGTTPQSIRKSSSRALPAVGLSGIRTHLNPGGADGACADGAAGSLNLASETPSLTPALIAEYSTQYVSSSPIPAAINGNSRPNPINPTAASPSLEAADLKTASAQVDQVEGTIYRPIGEYVDWLFAELARLDGMPSSPDYPSYRECQAALRVYMRFVDHRLGRA